MNNETFINLAKNLPPGDKKERIEEIIGPADSAEFFNFGNLSDAFVAFSLYSSTGVPEEKSPRSSVEIREIQINGKNTKPQGLNISKREIPYFLSNLVKTANFQNEPEMSTIFHGKNVEGQKLNLFHDQFLMPFEKLNFDLLGAATELQQSGNDPKGADFTVKITQNSSEYQETTVGVSLPLLPMNNIIKVSFKASSQTSLTSAVQSSGLTLQNNTKGEISTDYPIKVSVYIRQKRYPYDILSTSK